MSSKVLVLLMLFSLALCLKTIEGSEIFLKAGNPSYAESRAKIISELINVNSKIKYSYPNDYTNFIKKFDVYPGVEYIEDLVELSQIKSGSYLLPDDIKKFLFGLANSSLNTYHYVTFTFSPGNNNIIEYGQANIYLVSALRIEDLVLFGIIHSNIKANLKEFYSKVKRTAKERQWWCLWICETEKVWYENVRRNPLSSEKVKIQNALQAKSGDLIKMKLNSLK